MFWMHQSMCPSNKKLNLNPFIFLQYPLKRKMPLLCSVSDIKYTVIILEEDEYEQIVNSEVDDAADEWIHGYIRHGKFVFPYQPESPADHWSNEIIAAYPDKYMIVIKGSPDRVDVTLERYIAMERDWYHQHDLYDIWETSVGYVAVC